ncbi:MAG: hypothetical protein ACRCXC_09200 [Legionella sp.]
MYFFISSLVLLLLIIFEFHSILSINQGTFSYSLDDPYIHLSLAKHIGIGEYGLITGENASPVSSIAWDFLLAPFSYFSWFEFVPLVLNILFSLAILWVFITAYLLTEESHHIRWRNVILFCLLIPALNLVGLIFSGMEHSLQLLLSVLLIYGLIIESREERFTPWLSVVLIAGPLIRYENLALSLPALVFLFYRGYRKKVIYAFSILCILLALFSLFLIHINQGILPTSIFNKMDYQYSHSVFEQIHTRFNKNLSQHQAIIFAYILFIFIVYILCTPLSKVKKQLLAVLAASIFLHLFFGRFNWYHRYELYIYASVWLLILYLYFDIRSQSQNQIRTYFLLLFGLIFASWPYFTVLYTLPLATNNIYEQQYQMRKFTVRWLKGPVAVNDIGWVSMNNPDYVLDLWGLGNYQLFQERKSHKTSQWMDTEAKKHHVKLAMIYANWFPSLPSNWILLGCLFFKGKLVSAGGPCVHFYATDASDVSQLTKQLKKFAMDLPPGSEFRFHCNS